MKRDFVCIDDLSNTEIERLLSLTHRIKYEEWREYGETRIECRGKEMLGLFFEPSTRTRLSFERAMHKLGGDVSMVNEIGSSSLAKGETLADTARVVSGMDYDLIVMRHPWEGAAQAFADYSRVPVINAGDGSHEHPSQTLIDLYTIRRHKGHLNNLRVGLCGDLKYGRTVHSLAIALTRFRAKAIICLGLSGLEMPEWILNRLSRTDTAVVQLAFTALPEIIEDLDVLYMTRVQKERLPAVGVNGVDYDAAERAYTINRELLQPAKEDLFVLHPLPRTQELPREIDSDPRAKYFEQSDNGVPARMALIAALLGKVEIFEPKPQIKYKTAAHERCLNPRCVTMHQDYVEPRFACLPSRLSCFYCGHLL